MSQPKKPEHLPDLAEIASKYELDLSRGILKSDGAEDHARMMEAIATYKAMHGTHPPIQEAMNLGRPSRILAKSMRFSEATAAYLDEKKHQNAAQTLVEKGRTYKDFTALFGDLEINLISKAEIVQWKTVNSDSKLIQFSIIQRLNFDTPPSSPLVRAAGLLEGGLCPAGRRPAARGAQFAPAFAATCTIPA